MKKIIINGAPAHMRLSLTTSLVHAQTLQDIVDFLKEVRNVETSKVVSLTASTKAPPKAPTEGKCLGTSHALTFLVDTGSQITIISSVPLKPTGINVDIQGVNSRTRAPRETIEILLYDKPPIPVLAAFMPALMDILGMDAIPLLFPLWIPYRQLKNMQTTGVALSSVSIQLIKLPPSHLLLPNNTL
jgi:hypothetical protein